MTFLSLIGLCAVAAAPADTLSVETARCITPVEFRRPYQTDSLNLAGKAYDVNKLLDDNAAIAQAAGGYDCTIERGCALAVDTMKGMNTMNAMRFFLNADRFTKAKLDIKTLKNYKIYVDGKLHSGKDLTLTPGRTGVTLLTLSGSADKDTFNVSVTGESLAGLTVGESGKQPYTMAKMIQGDHYRSVSLSPSGKYLVTVYYYTKADGSNLYRTTLTETASGRVVLRRAEYVDLRWWPRQDLLYYTRDGAEGRELVTLNPEDMTEKVVATGIPGGGFTLSPDGTYAIYSRSQKGREEMKDGLKRLEQPDDRMPGWRNRSYLCRYDFASRQMQPLTFGETSAWLNDISPDGQRLLIAYSRMEPSRAPFSRTTLVEMNAGTGKVDTVFCDTAFIGSAQYSPDGKQLLIAGSPSAFGGIGLEVAEGQIPNAYDNRLYCYDLSAKKLRFLLEKFAPSVGQFQWNYGDGNIYFRATDGCNESLFRLDPDTKKVTRFALPVSYVQGFSIAKGQKQPRAAFFGQTGERARELFMCTLDGEKPKAKRIGEIDFDKDYADVAIGSCCDWSFKASRGDTISGFYFLPPDFDSSKKYPLIVYYYGGCTPTAKTLEFHYPLQVLAGQGYIVYVCEPSGAIGFGQEFAARHVNTWGQGSADDIIEGTKAFLKAHPYVDSKRVGCMGASYGGFMTQYLQTRTDLFAAAISHAGISNIASYWGGGYWGYTYGEAAQYGSFPWNNPELYVKQSPLFNADKINTPLLLLHGTVDTNVPTTESQQLFTALRILGRPVSYIQIDGENHVITNYNKRLAWQNVIFAWFAKWLKDEPLWWKTLYPADNHGQK